MQNMRQDVQEAPGAWRTQLEGSSEAERDIRPQDDPQSRTGTGARDAACGQANLLQSVSRPENKRHATESCLLEVAHPQNEEVEPEPLQRRHWKIGSETISEKD